MSNKVSSETIFRTNAGDPITLEGVVRAMRNYILEQPNASYEVAIGSDSQAYSSGTAAFVSAVVLRRIGNGGIHFWVRNEERFFNLKDRIWRETMRSITLAQELRSLLKEKLGEEIFWEEKLQVKCIHLDVGIYGPTRELVDGVCGTVRGFGFEPVIKPYSYGAFVVADRHT